jgi:sugar lactone lactonase YvrE/PKD repeat protein
MILPTPSRIARPQALGTIAVLLRTAALLLFPLLTACVDETFSPAGGVTATESPAFAIAAPRSPALLVTSRATSPDGVVEDRIVRFDASSGAFLGALTDPVSTTSHREMAFGPDGNLYVADGPGNRVLRYDGTSGASLGTFIPAGSGLVNPSGLAFGPDGHLYVSAGGDNRVRQYNGVTGAYMRLYSGLSDPQSVTFRADGVMFVAARAFNDVRRFDATLNRFVVVASNSNSPLSQPMSVRFGPDGNLYVASYGTGTVLRYDGQTGTFLGIFASGNGLVAPGGMAFGPDGELYVSDFASGSVLRFDGETGKFIDTFVPAATGGLSSPRYLAFSGAPVNHPATVLPGGPYQGLEGSAIAFDASSTFDEDGDALRFEWDFGDGVTGTGASVQHSFDDNGIYTAVLTVTDERGSIASTPVVVTVDNVAPSAAFMAPVSAAEGGSFELTVTGATDPSPGDTESGFTYAFNCGDGSGYGAAGTATSIICAAIDDDTRDVGVRVADRDGGESEYVATMQIGNVAPELSTVFAPVGTLKVGDAASFQVAVSDVGSADTHVGSVNWGDGTTTALTVNGGASGTHAYLAAGTYTITVTVTDDDGGSSVMTFAGIQVTAPPTNTLPTPGKSGPNRNDDGRGNWDQDKTGDGTTTSTGTKGNNGNGKGRGKKN